MRICLVLEGSYPYVHGGVSTWMHAYIQAMPQQEFSLWVIGAKAQDRGKFVYELPPNVKEVEEVFLDDALRLHGERQPVLFTADERTALRELVRLGSRAGLYRRRVARPGSGPDKCSRTNHDGRRDQIPSRQSGGIITRRRERMRITTDRQRGCARNCAST